MVCGYLAGNSLSGSYLSTMCSISAQMEKRKKSPPTWEKSRMGKSLRPPEVILGLPYTSKADIWVLGCTVRSCVVLALDCHLIFRFFCKDISFVDWKTTRPRREGRRRWDHAWLAYFHVRGNYSAGSRPQVQIKCAIF